MACSPDTIRRAHRFAIAASVLAQEASRLALSNLGPGHDAEVARRAADQARDAASALDAMASRGATLDATLEAAAWAMATASVALTQAKAKSATNCRVVAKATDTWRGDELVRNQENV